MELPIYQVDAFAEDVFHGNPAAVMPLESWIADELLQALAAENNLSETAFLVATDDAWELRWFTPRVEVDLCGHATLASAHVLFEHLCSSLDKLNFDTRSGRLVVERRDSGLTLDFPATALQMSDVDIQVCNALGATASETLVPAGKGAHLYVYEFESDIAALEPDFGALKGAGVNVIATAPGDECDFVSRFFAPMVGIDEDPVTGSAHCALVPYWSARLNKPVLEARQISERGGRLLCEHKDDRVLMTGRGVTFMQGTVSL